jgi:hypothetical protein
MALSVSTVSPSTGSTAGGTVVIITGTDFTGASAVAFRGVAAASFTVLNSMTITCVSPAGTVGACDVGVETGGGAFYAAKVNGFTYVQGSLSRLLLTETPLPLGAQAGGTLLIQGTSAQLGVTGTYDAETEDEQEDR